MNFVFNREAVFRLLGILNSKFSFITSVFVAYPASEEYALAYVYPKHRHLMRWSPWPVGIFQQNGKWGVTFVISSTEPDFAVPDNADNLKRLVSKTEKIRLLLGAQQKTFAGILPGILFRKRLVRDVVEANVTVMAVIKAEEAVRNIETFSSRVPIIILGSRGFIGRRLISHLSDREVYGIDIEDNALCSWPDHLYGRDAVIINLTRKAALNDYISKFWSSLILINEVYPEPLPSELTELADQGCRGYHIVGVNARAYPPFPKAYRGGIPCCAARTTEGMAVMVRRII
ncbi:MAG: hypothetical protein WA957_09225 [Alteraurantiacibacter sp.]